MKVLQIAPLWERVPPKRYGGIELIAYHITEGLIKRGHNVTLYATGDSITSAKLVSVYPRALYRDKIPWTNKDYSILNASIACKAAKDFDIVHSHSIYPVMFSKLIKTPIVTTLHGPLPIENERSGRQSIYKEFKDSNFVSISNSQRRLPFLNYTGTVYNGIDINKYIFNDEPKKYLLWMGRVSDKKGTVEAIKVAKKLKMKLILAGKLDYIDMPYYNKKVKPLLDTKNIRYLGEVSEKQKIDLYRNAYALLMPIKWQEPFGLVMTEAMACGTPVIAFNRASVPEIIVHNKTGFIVNNISQMVKAVKKIDNIDRKACRKHVQKNFTVDTMVENYIKIYKKVLNKK